MLDLKSSCGFLSHLLEIWAGPLYGLGDGDNSSRKQRFSSKEEKNKMQASKATFPFQSWSTPEAPMTKRIWGPHQCLWIIPIKYSIDFRKNSGKQSSPSKNPLDFIMINDTDVKGQYEELPTFSMSVLVRSQNSRLLNGPSLHCAA